MNKPFKQVATTGGAMKPPSLDGATVRLAKGKKPPTIDGVINIGMDHSIHVPSEEAQRAGFTPYQLVEGVPVDATRELLRQYPGIYKPVTAKGVTNDN